MDESPSEYVPLTEPTFFILLSLQSGPKHGYAIAKDVLNLSSARVQLSISTLYTALKRLLDNDWVRMLEGDAGGPGRPRKTYELTRTGAQVLQAEVNRLDWLVQRARSQGVVTEGAA
jgi:DNA-binding PadR family transcriptional regulator